MNFTSRLLGQFSGDSPPYPRLSRESTLKGVRQARAQPHAFHPIPFTQRSLMADAAAGLGVFSLNPKRKKGGFFCVSCQKARMSSCVHREIVDRCPDSSLAEQKLRHAGASAPGPS